MMRNESSANRARTWARGAAAAAATSALLLSPLLSRPAEACGGFWCSLAQPVDQTSEQIIFVDHPDETVTAIIQINYQGPSEKFAWVIPIPGDPKIGVSSNTVFARLDGSTMPQYQLERHVEGMCRQDFLEFASAAGGCPSCAGAPMTDSTAPPPAIMVVNQGSVGPYDYATIAVDPSLADPADAAIDWFMKEGYDLTGVDAELLGPYLADGLNLLAFRLTKGADEVSGAIRPVVLTYESDKPMIPIRPTAVAAQPDMGIRVWVAGAFQAVPDNYLSLVLNEALIDWVGQSYVSFGGPFFPGSFGGGSLPQNYDAVVTEAANQAGGQGFVTELAAASKEYADALLSAEEKSSFEQIASAQYPDGIDAIWAANAYYRSWDGWREAIEDAVSLPEGVSYDDFGRNPDGYRGAAEVDVQKFFDLLRENVVGPVIEAQSLLGSRPYLTRLYSTMSADEMTVDPAFTYNGDLADVSRVHVAQQYIECSPDITEYEAPWRIELPQGGVITGQGGVWPIALDALPANLKIVQLSAAGSGAVLEDNSGQIGAMLFEQSGMEGSGEAIPEPPKTGVMIGGDQVVSMPGDDGLAKLGPPQPGTDATGASSSEGGCSVTRAGGGRAPAGFVLALVGAMAALVRRRRFRG